MNFYIVKLKNTINNFCELLSKKYKFRTHNNTRNRKIDNLFDTTKQLNKDIRKDITVKDFLYFVIRQAYDLKIYTKTNAQMLAEKITNVSEDAYNKQRKRKSFELLKSFYFVLNEFYEKECINIKGDAFPDSTSETDVLIKRKTIKNSSG